MTSQQIPGYTKIVNNIFQLLKLLRENIFFYCAVRLFLNNNSFKT